MVILQQTSFEQLESFNNKVEKYKTKSYLESLEKSRYKRRFSDSQIVDNTFFCHVFFEQKYKSKYCKLNQRINDLENLLFEKKINKKQNFNFCNFFLNFIKTILCFFVTYLLLIYNDFIYSTSFDNFIKNLF